MAFNAGAVVGHAILDTKGWTGGMAKMKGSNTAMTKGLAGMSAGFLAAAAAAAAVGAAIGLTTAAANKFETSMANVSTLVDTASVSTKGMANEILALDSRLGSAKELTDALYQALSAGVEPAKAVAFVGESAKFAKAGLTDAFTAVDVLTTAINAYGLSADSATGISDILFQTIKLGKTTGAELASTLGDVIPTAATLGVEMDELGAAMVAFTKQGINTANATTQLRALFTAFIKPSEAMTEALKAAGHESGSMLLQTEGLAGALKFLEEQTGGNIEALSELLPNQRAIKAAFALGKDSANEYTTALAAMGEASGSTQTAFEKQRLGFQAFKNELNKLSIRIGQAFLPAVDDITGMLTKTIKNTREWIEENQIVEKTVKTLGRAMTVTKIAFDAWKEPLDDLVNTRLTGFAEVLELLAEPFADLSKDSATTAASISKIGIAIKFFEGTMIASIGILKLWVVGFNSASKAMASFLTAAGFLGTGIARALANGAKSFKLFSNFVTGRIRAVKEIIQGFAEIVGSAFDFKKLLSDGPQKYLEDLQGDVKGLAGTFSDFTNKSKDSWGDFAMAISKVNPIDDLTKGIEVARGIIQKSNGEIAASFKKVSGDIKADLDQNTVELINMIRESGAVSEDILSKLNAAFNGTSEGTTQTMEEEWQKKTAIVENGVVKWVDSFKTLGSKITDLTKKTTAAVAKDWSGLVEGVTKNIQFGLDHAADLFSGITDTISMGFENELKELEKAGDDKIQELEDQKETVLEQQSALLEEEMTILQEKRDNELISEEEFQAMSAEAQQNFSNKTAEIDKKHDEKILAQKDENQKKKDAKGRQIFEAQKATDIGNIWLAFATGTMGIWSGAFATIPNPIAAAVVAGILTTAFGVLAGVQTGLVAQQKYVPGAATGGTVTKPGLFNTDELGGEIKRFTTGDVIIPDDVSMAMAERAAEVGGGNNISVSFAGANITDNMSLRKISNRVSRDLSRQLRLQS